MLRRIITSDCLPVNWQRMLSGGTALPLMTVPISEDMSLSMMRRSMYGLMGKNRSALESSSKYLAYSSNENKRKCIVHVSTSVTV